MSQLLLFPDPRLLQSCEPFDFQKDDLSGLVTALSDGLKQSRSTRPVSIAANQVGIMKRVFMMGGTAYVNPRILSKSSSPFQFKEGCLSSPGIYEMIQRSEEISLEYWDPMGRKHRDFLKGFESICAQHEMDHLDGIFWFSRMSKSAKRRVRNKSKLWNKHKIWENWT